MRKILYIFTVLALMTAASVYATDIGVEGAEAGDATIYVYPDNGDDAADRITIVGKASGGLIIYTNGRAIFTFASDGSITIPGATGLTLANGASINNDAAGDVNVLFTNESAALATFAVKSSAASNNIADNDIMEITFESVDSLAAVIEYGEIECKLTDVTTASVDAQLIFKTYSGDASTTMMTIGANAAGVELCTIVPNLTITGDLLVSGNDIDSGAGAMTVGKAAATSLTLGATDITTTNLGPFTATEVTIDGKFAVTGNDAVTPRMTQSGTCTNGQTVSYGAAFAGGSTPQVYVWWVDTANAGTTNAYIQSTSVASNQFVVTAQLAVGGVLTNAAYTAFGERP